jgi:hypothetical protein
MTFWALLYKELRMDQVRFAINLAFLALFTALIFYLIEFRGPEFIVFPIMVIIAHFFYLFFVMLYSMHREWSNGTAPFWLNTPQNGWKLIGAKYIVALVHFTVSLILSYLIAYFLLMRMLMTANEIDVSGMLAGYWWLSFLFIFMVSAILGAAAVFIYTMAKSIRKWGWFLALVILGTASYLWGKLMETGLYQTLVQWGPLVSYDPDQPLGLLFASFQHDSGRMEMQMETILYMGNIVEDVLIIIILLGASVWLLDRKVEV